MKKHLRDKLIRFREERDWDRYHTGNNLAHALMIEAAELNRLFMWGSEPNSEGGFVNLCDELADIAIYLEYMLVLYGVDIDKVVEDKIKKNAIKYPL